MNSIANLLTSLIVASWMVAIAVLSLQNVTPVSLKFLTYQSIQVPFFLVLAFSASLGLIFMALIQPLWGNVGSRQATQSDDLDSDFSFDDEDGNA